MIRQVKITFEPKPKEHPVANSVQPMDGNNPYTKLTSVIADLNTCSENYSIFVHICDSQSYAPAQHFSQQVDRLLGSLTRRELEVFDLAINGLCNRLIAEKLFITVETVRSHRKNIVSKAGASSVEEIKTWILKAKV